MRYKRLSGLLALLMVSGMVAPAYGQPIFVIDHEPWLNWDFVPPAGANDLHIVVENPNFTLDPADPNQLFVDPGWQFDGITQNVDNAILSWSAVNPGAIVHAGANMTGAGRIVDAYWTQNGVEIPGAKIPIIWELTRIQVPDTQSPPEIWMRLQTSEAFIMGNPDLEVRLLNVRTFSDIPADMLNLPDINESLDMNRLLPYEAMAYPEITLPSQPWDIDSFFDVFVELTIPENVSPDFESLLIADVVVVDLSGNQTSVGRFWNLNPQSPEPGTVALLAIGACVTLFRRRRK